MKAVLTLKEVEFRKTHDLDELLTLFEMNNLGMPPHSDDLDELNPYAVALRYDLFDTEILDKEFAKKIVEKVRSWTEEMLRE